MGESAIGWDGLGARGYAGRLGERKLEFFDQLQSNGCNASNILCILDIDFSYVRDPTAQLH